MIFKNNFMNFALAKIFISTKKTKHLNHLIIYFSFFIPVNVGFVDKDKRHLKKNIQNSTDLKLLNLNIWK